MSQLRKKDMMNYGNQMSTSGTGPTAVADHIWPLDLGCVTNKKRHMTVGGELLVTDEDW